MARVTLGEIVEPVDPNPAPALVAHRRLLENEVQQALAELKPEAKALLCLRFGLGGSYCHTVEEIARVMRRTNHFVS
jgi:DNA-directed RNA polymerase sigma subunit (sigma70/sigma32)